MVNYKGLYSAVKAAEKIMNEWSDDEDNEVDIAVLPPGKVDALTDNDDIDEDQLGRQGLPNNVCGNIQIQTNLDDANSANHDVDSIEKSSWSSKTDPPSANVLDQSSDADEKEKKVIGLLEKIENEKNIVTNWKSTLPIRNQLLEPVKGESKTVKDSKNAIMEELAGKQRHEAFEKYVNAELKEMIVTETNRYAAQKNRNSTSKVTDLETFNTVLILTVYHSLLWTRIFWEKEEDIGLSIVYESISRKEFEDNKRYIYFADNNQLDTKHKFAKVRKPYDIMNKNLQQFNFFHSYYSVDEQIVPYTGKNSSKQTIRTKTVHFGYKNFVMCSDDSYPYFIDPYCGCKYGGQNKASKNLCARSVIDCASKIDDWRDKEVFFDN